MSAVKNLAERFTQRILVANGVTELDLMVIPGLDYESAFIGICRDTGDVLRINSPWDCEITELTDRDDCEQCENWQSLGIM